MVCNCRIEVCGRFFSVFLLLQCSFWCSYSTYCREPPTSSSTVAICPDEEQRACNWSVQNGGDLTKLACSLPTNVTQSLFFIKFFMDQPSGKFNCFQTCVTNNKQSVRSKSKWENRMHFSYFDSFTSI